MSFFAVALAALALVVAVSIVAAAIVVSIPAAEDVVGRDGLSCSTCQARFHGFWYSVQKVPDDAEAKRRVVRVRVAAALAGWTCLGDPTDPHADDACNVCRVPCSCPDPSKYQSDCPTHGEEFRRRQDEAHPPGHGCGLCKP